MAERLPERFLVKVDDRDLEVSNLDKVLYPQAGFTKGYPGGSGPRISSKHTLALVNPGDATADSLVALAREIRDGVLTRFGVELTAEPTLIGLKL